MVCSALAVGCGRTHADVDVDADTLGMDAGPPSPRDAGDPPEPPDIDVPDGSAPLPDRCFSGTSAPCVCEDGRTGLVFCEDWEWTGECECPPEPAPTVDAGVPGDGAFCEEEYCDGRDNDCDGVADEGFACPDPTVSGALPYDGTVYAIVETGGDEHSLVPIWPDGRAATVDGLEQSTRFAAWNQFRRDGVLTYRSFEAGLFEHVADGPDRSFETPPCFRGPLAWGFDGADTIVYACEGALRRGSGEVIAGVPDGQTRVVGVGPSGRALLLAEEEDRFLVVDTDSTIRDVTPPPGEWVGRLYQAHHARGFSTQGESVFYVLPRSYRDGSAIEMVVFRVDLADATRQVVRRVPVDSNLPDGLVLPDGRYFYLYTPGGGPDQRVLELPPDGPAREVWWEPGSGRTVRALVATP